MTSFPLYLMRHGAPVRAGLMLGHSDCAASAEGVADCLAQARDLEPMALYSSDLRRARACAEAIGAPRLDPRWRELDFGAWDGLAAADIAPDPLAAFWRDPDGSPPPGGERWSALVARVGAAIEDLPAAPALIVTHGGAMRAALAYLCGLSDAATWAVDLPCACVLGLTIWEGPPRRGQMFALWP